MQHQEDGEQPSPRHFVYLVYPTSRRTLLCALTIPHMFPDLMDGLALASNACPKKHAQNRPEKGVQWHGTRSGGQDAPKWGREGWAGGRTGSGCRAAKSGVSAKETVQAHQSSGQVLPKSPRSRFLHDRPLSSIFAPVAPIGLGHTYAPHPCHLSLPHCHLSLPTAISPCPPPSLLARHHLSLPVTISPCPSPSLLARHHLSLPTAISPCPLPSLLSHCRLSSLPATSPCLPPSLVWGRTCLQ